MRLSEIYNDNRDKKTVFSIEIFPPKEPDYIKKTEKLLGEIEKLAKYDLGLISVTYGAGGNGREKSNDIVKEVKTRFGKTVMPHFTCVCSTREFIKEYLNEINEFGIKNILALKGDVPMGSEDTNDDFDRAYELIEFIKSTTELEIAAAGYPECHQMAYDFESDISNLKKKVNNGAVTIFTQLFFENHHFYKYKEMLDKKNISTPVVAGILPVISFEQLGKMADMSGIILGTKIINYFEKYKDSKEDTIKAGIEWAHKQAQCLIENETDGIHFYTLNKAYSTGEILKNL